MFLSQMLFDWNQAWNDFLAFAKTAGLKLLEVVALLVIGVIAIKIVAKLLNKILGKTKLNKVTIKFLISIVKFALYFILLIAIFQALGIEVTGLISVISAAGLALSLAIQGSLSNLANGVVIIGTQPFKEGDYVQIAGIEGTVVEIKMLHTILNTIDNKRISIPNTKVVENELINYSANPTRKVVFNFAVDYAADVDKAKEIILKVITSCDKALLEPAPFCALKTLDDSSIGITANCWCKNADYWDVYYYVMDNAFNELKRENINIPYNQMEVRVRTDEVTMPVREDALKQRDESAPTKHVVEEKDLIAEIFSKAKKKSKAKKEQKQEDKTKKDQNKETKAKKDKKSK